MQKDNIKAINNQNSSYYFANYKDNLDLDQCSRFTQGYVAAELGELARKLSDCLRKMMDAQSKTIGSSIAAGFGTAVASIVEGAFESAGGFGTAGAGGYQAEESGKNALKISDAQKDFQQDLSDYNTQKNLSTAGQIKGNNPAGTNAAQQPGTAQIELKKVAEEPVVVKLTQPREQPAAQPQVVQSAIQTQTPVATPISRPVAEVEGTTRLESTPVIDDTVQIEIGTEKPPLNQQVNSTATPDKPASTPEEQQPDAEKSETQKDLAKKPNLGKPTSDLKKNGIQMPNSEEIIRVKHEGALKKLDQENQRGTQIGSAIQAGSQALSQLPTQGSRASAQTTRTGQETFDKTAAATQSAGQSIDKTVEQLTRINPFQQNESIRG